MGYKNVYQVSTGPEEEVNTVLLFFTVSLYKEWILGKSESGWMKIDIFYDYFVKSLNLWLTEKKIKRPALVLFNGHKSHLTLKICEDCGIELKFSG